MWATIFTNTTKPEKLLGAYKMTTVKKIAIFNYWFKWHGHWLFGTRGYDKAYKAWKTQGIEGLPAY